MAELPERRAGKKKYDVNGGQQPLSGGEHVTISAEDVVKNFRNPNHMFPDIDLGEATPDHNRRLLVTEGAAPWLQRALYLFKYNKKLEDVSVSTGGEKMVIVDNRSKSAFSLEYKGGARHFNIYRQRLEKLAQKTAGMRVVGTLGYWTDETFDDIGRSTGGIIIRRMTGCYPKDMFDYVGLPYKDAEIERVLSDLVEGIMPSLMSLHRKRIYHNDIKVENIFYCNVMGTEGWTLGDLDGSVMLEDEESQMDLASKERILTHSSLTAMFPGKWMTGVAPTEDQMRLNDLGALSLIILMFASRFYYALANHFKKRTRITTFLWKNIFSINTPVVTRLPTSYNDEFWLRMGQLKSRFEVEHYEKAMSRLQLNPFTNTIRFCHSVFEHIAGHMEGKPTDGLPNFGLELTRAFLADQDFSVEDAGRRYPLTPLRRSRRIMEMRAPRAKTRAKRGRRSKENLAPVAKRKLLFPSAARPLARTLSFRDALDLEEE